MDATESTTEKGVHVVKCPHGTTSLQPFGWECGHASSASTVREEHIISLEEAVHKMSGLTADQLHLKDRGLIREGFAADLVIFGSADRGRPRHFCRPVSVSDGHRHGHRQWPSGTRQGTPYWWAAWRDHPWQRDDGGRIRDW